MLFLVELFFIFELLLFVKHCTIFSLKTCEEHIWFDLLLCWPLHLFRNVMLPVAWIHFPYLSLYDRGSAWKITLNTFRTCTSTQGSFEANHHGVFNCFPVRQDQSIGNLNCTFQPLVSTVCADNDACVGTVYFSCGSRELPHPADWEESLPVKHQSLDRFLPECTLVIIIKGRLPGTSGKAGILNKTEENTGTLFHVFTPVYDGRR